MKVRIKKKTKPGDQVDYSLATGNMYGHINDEAYDYRNPMVKDTLQKVPREEANIEAEGGETIIGDFDDNGLLEHSKVSGKRHYQGGVPLNVPDGSFVFSDTSKLNIKDKDTQEYFGKKFRKGGYTPAQLAKQYDLNKHNATLQDPKASRLEKETAMKMIADNTKKLSELALVQESMKGMPNGVPSFVESVMGDPTQAKHGGKVINLPIPLQKGGTTYPRTDIRSYGVVGRGLYDLHDAIGKGYRFVGSEIVDALKYDHYLLTNPNSPIRKGYSNFVDNVGEAIYDAVINPTDVKVDPRPVIENKSLPVNPNRGVSRNTEKVRTVTIDDFQKGGEYQDEEVNISIKGVTQKGIARTYKNGTRVLLDSNGRILNSTSNQRQPQSSNTQTEVNAPAPPQYTQYGNKTFSKILEEQDKAGNVIWAKQKFDPFGVQHQIDSTGIYGRDDYDWEDFKSRHGDWIETEYGDYGGIEGFLRDIKDPSKSKTATKWFQDKVNEASVAEHGVKYFSPENGSPYGNDGEFGMVTYSVPRYFKRKQSVEVPAEPTTASTTPPATPTVEKQETIKPGVPFENELTRPRDDRMYLEDQLGILNAMTDRVNTYMPKRQQVDFVAPDATYLDPSRQVASIQEQAARFQDLAMNTSDGQVARANVLGSSGQSAAQTADVIANYENQNVQIANNNAMQVADIENKERLTNTELDARYIQELATVNQNRDNALRQLKNNRYAQVINGVKNRRNKKMFEQVLFPQVSTDSITGDWYTVNGRNINDVVQTYSNPGFGSTSQDPTAAAFDLSKRMINMKRSLMEEGMTKEEAEWAANNAMKTVRPNLDTSDSLFRQQFMNMYPF